MPALMFWRRAAIAWLCLLLGSVLGAVAVAPAWARPSDGGTVSGSCTEADLEGKLAGGGAVTFSCGAAPKTIVLSTSKVITRDTSLDGGNLITLSGGNSTRLFFVSPGHTLTLTNIVLDKGN